MQQLPPGNVEYCFRLGHYHFHRICSLLRVGADKFLALPTYRCRRTGSVVSERGICSCAELEVFSCCGGWKEACQTTCAISKSRPSCQVFISCKEIHAIRTNIREQAPSYTTVKNWVVQFKRGDFSTCVAPRPADPKLTTPEIIKISS
jgi:hypothetical protein